MLFLSLGLLGGFLWCWYPWNVPGCPCCCMSFLTTTLVHGCKVPLWRCCCCLFVPLLLLLVLIGWLSVEFCPLWMLCLQLNLLCRLFRAHGGKLQAYEAYLMYSISLLIAFWLMELLWPYVLKWWKHYVCHDEVGAVQV